MDFAHRKFDVPQVHNQAYRQALNDFTTSFQFFKKKIATLYLDTIRNNTALLQGDTLRLATDKQLRIIRTNDIELLSKNEIIVERYYHYISELHNKQLSWYSFLVISNVILLVVLLLLVVRFFQEQLLTVTHVSQQIAQGNMVATLDDELDQGLRPLADSLLDISENIRNATNFALNIGEGKLDINLAKLREGDKLGKALFEMRDKLRKVTQQEDERRWIINGRAELGEILRNNQRNSLEDLCNAYLSKLVQYMNFNQGSVFLKQYNTSPNNDAYMQLFACYAYDKRKYMERKLAIGQGLIGQCFLEKNSIYLENIPNDYVYITSGLGEANPTSLLLVPIITEDEVFGVIELASFSKIRSHQIQFIETAAEMLANSIATIEINLKTQKLLEDAKKANAELTQKDTLMQKNAQELQNIRVELDQKLLELKQEANMGQRILDAINKTNVTIEFDFDGNILNVNDMFLRVTGYTRQDVIGKNEMLFLPLEEVNSQRYHLLWESLRNGSYITGEYRRISKTGKEIWLNGTYNPIFDIHGKPLKVIKFAQFTTEEKEKDHEFSSRIAAINHSLPIVELDTNGKIKSVNQLFAQTIGYKRIFLVGKNMLDFLEDKRDFQNLWENLLKGESKSETFLFVTADNTLMYFICTFSPIKNLMGQVHKIHTVLVNITEQKNMEIELLNNEATLQNTIEQLSQAQGELEEQRSELRRMLSQERAKNRILASKDASTELMFTAKLEEILRHIDQIGQTDTLQIVQNATMPLIEIDTTGRICQSNESFKHMVGYQQTELKQLLVRSIVNFGEHDKEIHTRLLQGDVIKEQAIVKNKDGFFMPAKVIAIPIFNDKLHILVFVLEN